MAYNFRLTEKKWQEFWKNNKTYKTHNSPSKKAYILEMLPYPSGHLHMGHVRNYSIGDAIARFKIAQGFDVLHPMGWDAFGLPAENAALERAVHPKNWTLDNIENMKEQLCKLGLSYDWDREIASCLPNYYGHEQKIFLDFYKNGLAYKKESWVNWDPVEQSVLANEQVVDGKGWRSGANVERKKLNQWFLKITAYADELLDSLKDLAGWPEKVTKMQENWIGKSKGALVQFDVDGEKETTIEIFTTRPETLFGASFVAISAHHPLLKKINMNERLHNFIKECDQSSTAEAVMSTKEKKGVDTGLKAIHPLDNTIKLPIYIANFVLSDYGTGALFGCPAHDERDFEFAQKYNLPILPVIETTQNLPYLGHGNLINSSFLNGLTLEEGFEKACNRLNALEKGRTKTTYRLRDWLISRQRYWGCPIPIIYCDDCGIVPVPEKDLPVTLPNDVSFDKPGNPLDQHPTWKHTTCPTCKKKALRETDTLDTFFESSWYFLRYCSPDSDTPLEKESVNAWAPIDWYVGGIEHAVLHLLYARFFTKALRDLNYLSFSEPFVNLLTQGMVCHETYKSIDGKWLYPEEIEKEKGQVFHRETKQPVHVGSPIKMSKSKRNTIDPLSIIETYGADVARLFVLSDTPPDKDFSWNEEGLEGCWRYANKLWRLIERYQGLNFDHGDAERSKICLSDVHQNLEKITSTFAQNGFNKAIAFHREMVRSVEEHLLFLSKNHVVECLSIVFKTIKPVMPHIAHEALKIIGIEDFTWPISNPKYCSKNTVTMAISINGKLRGTIDVSVDDSKDAVEQQAKMSIAHYLKDKTIRKIIVVPLKIVNFVVD
jgi:leucyl-tRNA synthetase